MSGARFMLYMYASCAQSERRYTVISSYSLEVGALATQTYHSPLWVRAPGCNREAYEHAEVVKQG
jgi:hypothetical protein